MSVGRTSIPRITTTPGGSTINITMPRTPAAPPASDLNAQLAAQQQALQDLVGKIPLPADTSAYIANQQALQQQIAAMYRQAQNAQQQGYLSALNAQARLNQLLGEDPTKGADEQLQQLLEQQRIQRLNAVPVDRAMHLWGFQKNG